ncbi:hypothetical protein [Flavobacterium mesophilum]|uniref:hypothetical protein n=1 Tax=Flavobacterium mesophilum TaxID=3143495 RepID=UPI0031E09AB4
MKKIIILLLLFNLISCKKEIEKTEPKEINIKPQTQKLSFDEQLEAIKKGTSKDSILSNDIQFINDSILKGKFKLDISKYEAESKKKECFPIRLPKKMFNEFYNEGFNNLGDLNGDKKDDFVFVLHALNYCEEGDSYYFTDNSITRILTDSNCCHSSNILNIGDIDEDGQAEIAEYYSSCASRFKSITIYSLKNNKWKEIKTIPFALNDEYYIDRDFKKLFKKISKNNLKYFEISDIDAEGKIIASWKKLKIE